MYGSDMSRLDVDTASSLSVGIYQIYGSTHYALRASIRVFHG